MTAVIVPLRQTRHSTDGSVAVVGECLNVWQVPASQSEAGHAGYGSAYGPLRYCVSEQYEQYHAVPILQGAVS